MLKYIVVYFISFILFTSCAVTDIMELAQEGESFNSPMWDINFSIPVVKTTISFNSGNIIPSDIRLDHSNSLVESRWPVSESVNLNCASSSPFNVMLDIDDNGIDDFIIKKIRSEEAVLEVEIMVNVDGMPVTISSHDIGLSSIMVEGKSYPLTAVEESGTVLRYEASNFFDQTDAFIFNLSGSGSPLSVDIDRLDITCMPQELAEYNGTVSVVVALSISFGRRLSVIGDVSRSADLMDMTETIPLSQLPSEGIDEFGLWVDFNNSFPFSITMESALSSTDGSSRYYLEDVEGNRIIILGPEDEQRVYLTSPSFAKEDYDLRVQLKLESVTGVELSTQESVLVGVEVRGKIKLGIEM